MKNNLSRIINKIASINKERNINAEVDKANSILKNNPALRDEVVMRMKEDDLNIPDMAKAYADVDKIVQHIKLEEEAKEANTTSGKLATTAEKINNNGVVKMAGAVAGIGATIVTLITVVPKILQAVSDTKECSNKILKKGEKCVKTFDSYIEVVEKPEFEKPLPYFDKKHNKFKPFKPSNKHGWTDGNINYTPESVTSTFDTLSESGVNNKPESVSDLVNDAKSDARAYGILASRFGNDMQQLYSTYAKVYNAISSFNKRHSS